MPIPRDILAEYDGNYMARGWVRHDDDEPQEEHNNETSDLFVLALELSRAQWQRIKDEKGDS